jgi:phosphatidylserine/phosphatidylglycerophosphate/cardiolipin synthase-like enzyme
LTGLSLPRRGWTLVDKWSGDQLSLQMRRHHERRLRRVGWEHALDPAAGGWAGTALVRQGNSLELLVDGAEALPRIAEALEEACSHVHLTGWYFSPDFALARVGEPTILRNLLARLAERIEVRVLVWAGAPLPLFRPSRHEVRQMREQLTRNTDIACALDAKERPLHCHHEKTIVIDDRLAFVGGIDLTSKSGDRYDTSDHVARASVGWHDASALIAGPAVQDVAEHFRLRWHEVRGESLPAPKPCEPAGEVELQVVRTVPEKIYRRLPRGDFSILESYLRALKSAQRLIYLENQFLWSPEVAAVLADKLRHPPNPDFRLLLVLPAKPNSGADDTRGVLGELIEADEDNGRLLACTLYARSGALADPIYVHAKIAVIDDHWLTIGSANLNEHSLFNDTEMNLVTHDQGIATDTRLRLWSEHLELPVAEIPADTTKAIDEIWKPLSAEQLQRRQQGQPLTHRLVRLPNLSRRSGRALGPLSSLLVDG